MRPGESRDGDAREARAAAELEHGGASPRKRFFAAVVLSVVAAVVAAAAAVADLSLFLFLDLRCDELDQHRRGGPDARCEPLRRVVGDRQGAAAGGGGGGGEGGERVEERPRGAVVGRERRDVVDNPSSVVAFFVGIARAVSFLRSSSRQLSPALVVALVDGHRSPVARTSDGVEERR